MADGHSVRELLKVANLLYDARETNFAEEEEIGPPLDISSRLGQLKTCRVLASEITEKGASLYDLLGKEMELKDIRSAVISKPFELRIIESEVMEAIKMLQETLSITKSAVENLVADESNLTSKIEKKKVDYERAEKRLKSLQGVRPAYMDEYEKIETELIKQYEIYIQRFRNLTFLEQQLDEFNRVEQDKFEETESSLKRMQNRLREEELRLLRGDKEMRDTLKGGERYKDNVSARPSRPHDLQAASNRSRRSLKEQSETDSNSDDNIGSEHQKEDDVSVGFEEMEDQRRMAGKNQVDDESDEEEEEEDIGSEGDDDDDLIDDQDDDDIGSDADDGDPVESDL
ncbi:Clusterin-associated protein 1, partial [Nowakowskiella sp. JEL0078]